jgi:hypothetical protein
MGLATFWAIFSQTRLVTQLWNYTHVRLLQGPLDTWQAFWQISMAFSDGGK